MEQTTANTDERHQARVRKAARLIEQAQLQAGVADARALLRLAAVQALAGMGRSAIYARVSRGEFPAPIKLSSRCARWRAGDVHAWLEASGSEQ